MQKAKTRCSIKPHADWCIFHLHPSHCLSAQTLCVPSIYPCTILLLLFPLSVSFVFSASVLPALQLIWEGDPWALRGQVIQGHWQVISADWLTSKRTSGSSQSSLAPSTTTPPQGESSSPVHQQPVSHDQAEASEGGWLMMLLVPV